MLASPLADHPPPGDYPTRQDALQRTLTALRQWTEHYHAERNHQGLDNRLIHPAEHVGRSGGEVVRHTRLGGLLRYYHRDAA